MIADIRQLLSATPFLAFTIITSGGSRYLVASQDHANISPSGGRLVIFFDDDSSVIISALHITAVETQNSQLV